MIDCSKFIKILLSTVCGLFMMMEKIARDWQKPP